MKRSFLPTAKLVEAPYSSILGFPRATGRQLRSRAAELESLGVEKVAFWGQTRIGALSVLGKGYAGVVVLARYRGRTVAVKIRRTDSQRNSLAGEAGLLRRANVVGVGPRFVAASRNFLVMEYLDGPRISDWIAGVGGRGASAEARRVLAKILGDCFRLDVAGMDHGELSMISKHVIVGRRGRVTVIDFESSSVHRRTSNVTSATQAIFIGSGIAKKTAGIYRVPPKERIIEALREYKQDVSPEKFAGLLKVLRL